MRLSVDRTAELCAPWQGRLYDDIRCNRPLKATTASPPSPARASSQLLQHAVRISAAVSRNPSADALHAAALVELLTADTVRNSLDQAVSYLNMASRIDRSSPALLSDLAAAHLARAALWRDARELIAALDASARALDLDSLYAPALVNRTVALQQLALDQQAVSSAQRLLRVDSTSVWAEDLRSILANAREREARLSLPERMRAVELRAFVSRAPATAMTYAWNVLLGDWGIATLRGDSAMARERVERAEAIGEALAALGDSSTLDAVRAVQRVADEAAARRQLAVAHQAYAEVQQLRAANKYAAADSVGTLRLSRVAASPALMLWSGYAKANNLLGLRRNDEAARALESLRARVSSQRYPALAGRTLWAAALIELRRGRNAIGLRDLREARRLFERVGLGEYAAWTASIDGEVAVQASDEANGVNIIVESMQRLRETPTSLGHHNALFVLANTISRSGLFRAALAVQDEDEAISADRATPITRAESQLSRARLLVAIGDTPRAMVVIDRADGVIAAIPDDGMRIQLHHELGTIRGRAMLATNARHAWAVFDSSVRVLTPVGNAEKLLPALLGRAAAAVALKRDSAADADLRAVAELYLAKAGYLGDDTDARRQRLALVSQRDALMRLARPVFDSLIVRRLRRGGADAAGESLALFERWRGALSSPVTVADTRTPKPSTGRGAVARAMVLASVADQLVTWSAVGDSLTVRCTPMPGDSLEVLVERTRLALERNDASLSTPLLSMLYDLLLRSSAPTLGATGTTVSFVLDQRVANVPLAALYDSASRRYLVQQHAIRVSSDLASALRFAYTSATTTRARLLAVENPSFDRVTYPSLVPLASAAGEVRSVTSQYANVDVLRGALADSATVTRAVGRATVLHFAGHAMLDDVRPERSSLAMLPLGLSATSIAQLPLAKLELAVLSACETGRSADRRGSGIGELTSAFLLAGARGVVGSLWRTDDAATALLMSRFHAAFARSGDAAGALREAQVAMVERPPGEWAAFRYVGR